MSRGGGLRKCKCGQFYLLSEAAALNVKAGQDTPPTQFVDAADLADAACSPSKAVELVARRQWWMQLNDPYRDLYRAYRQAEDHEAQLKWKADWHAVNPDRRLTWSKVIDRLLRKKQAVLPPVGTCSFSVPTYQPSELQVQNMERILELILEKAHEPYGPSRLVVAELYRELGRFKEASTALKQCAADDVGVPKKLMEGLINEEQRAPIRYRL